MACMRFCRPPVPASTCRSFARINESDASDSSNAGEGTYVLCAVFYQKTLPPVNGVTSEIFRLTRSGKLSTTPCQFAENRASKQWKTGPTYFPLIAFHADISLSSLAACRAASEIPFSAALRYHSSARNLSCSQPTPVSEQYATLNIPWAFPFMAAIMK